MKVGPIGNTDITYIGDNKKEQIFGTDRNGKVILIDKPERLY